MAKDLYDRSEWKRKIPQWMRTRPDGCVTKQNTEYMEKMGAFWELVKVRKGKREGVKDICQVW